MRRREPISLFTFNQGFNNSVNPLTGGADTWADGSSNQFILGDNVVRPFKGYVTKGTSSGSRIAVQLGNTWGGLQDYTSVTASGSLVKDFLNILYTIGAGEASYEGQKIVTPADPPEIKTFASGNIATDATGNITIAAHGLTTGDQVYWSTYTVLPTSSPQVTATTSYFIIVVDANTVRLATTYTRAIAGTPWVTYSGAGTSPFAFNVGENLRASSVLQVASVAINPNYYTYLNQAGLDQPAAPVVTVPTTPGTGFTGLINGAIAFKLGAMRDRTQAGENIEDVNIAVKSVASTTSAVVVPINKTVKLQFPVAQSGQTHWAVFASKQGFGGTGVLLRIGYRTSSATNATWIWGIPEETVAAAVGRQLEFDFQDGDLYPEEAWLFDYQPPPGTHFLRLEACGVVLGCYDGTVCAVSLPNFLESYHPRHLLYLPEPVTAVLHRQSDDYAYVAGRNSIHAIQYVGYRGDDLPSATVTTISPDVGIVNQCNWAQCGSTIVAFLEGKGLVRMANGGNGTVAIDYEFGKEVANTTKNWDTTTVVSWNPTTQSVVAGCANESVSYCFESNAWGCPMFNTDAGITGSWLSAVNSRGELVVSLYNGSTHTAYSYDNNSSTTRMPVTSISRWYSNTAGARSYNVYEIEAAINQGATIEPVVMGLHGNLLPTYIRTVAMTSGSNVVTASSSVFHQFYTNEWMAVFGAGIGNRTFIATLSDSLFESEDHGFYTGQAVVLSTTGTLPTGLTAGVTYYVIYFTEDTFRLATTLTNAYANTYISTTGVGTGVHTVVINFLIGKIVYGSATTITLVDPQTNAVRNAGSTVSGMLAFVGKYFSPITPYPTAEQNLVNLRPAVQQCREIALSLWMPSDAAKGGTFVATAFGTESQTSVLIPLGVDARPASETYHILYLGDPILYLTDNIDYYH